VTSFISKHLPSAYLKAETNHELHYILPFDEAKKGGFEKLFSALDSTPGDLHIASYGIADTSLEEVFLKITESSSIASDNAGKPAWCLLQCLYFNFKTKVLTVKKKDVIRLYCSVLLVC